MNSKYKNFSRDYCPRVLIIALTITLAACGGGTSSTSAAAPSPVTAVAPIAPIAPVTLVNGQSPMTATGGTVEVTLASSPIKGAKVVVPPGTLPEGDETFTITYADGLPAPLNADAVADGAKQIGKTIVLRRTGVKDFNNVVSVTIPFDRSELNSDDVPVVVYFDPKSNSYNPITITNYDYINGNLTFITSHFSDYTLIKYSLPNYTSGKYLSNLAAIGVNFNSSIDGFAHENVSSFKTPFGSCLGIAAYSSWYHRFKKSGTSIGLFNFYGEKTITTLDDQVTRALVIETHKKGSQIPLIGSLNKSMDLKEAGQIYIERYLISELKITQQAQILVMAMDSAKIIDKNLIKNFLRRFFINNKYEAAHAVTVYSYDLIKQHFLVYDSNYPGVITTLPWNPNDGFGKYSKSPDAINNYDLFGFSSFSDSYSSDTLEKLYKNSINGANLALLPSININLPSSTNVNTKAFEITSYNDVLISGNIDGYPNDFVPDPSTKKYIHAFNKYEGRMGIATEIVDGKFSINIGNISEFFPTDVMLFVSQDKTDHLNLFHAFKKFTLNVVLPPCPSGPASSVLCKPVVRG